MYFHVSDVAGMFPSCLGRLQAMSFVHPAAEVLNLWSKQAGDHPRPEVDRTQDLVIMSRILKTFKRIQSNPCHPGRYWFRTWKGKCEHFILENICRLQTSLSDFQCSNRIPGWWFGCHEFYFPITIGLLIIPIDELIFFRGVAQPQPVINHYEPVINHYNGPL